MKRLLILACLILSSAASAGPTPCVPKTVWTPLGSGTELLRGNVKDQGYSVSWRAWWCPTREGTWYGYMHRNIDGLEGVSIHAVEVALDTAMRSANAGEALDQLMRDNTIEPPVLATIPWIKAEAAALDALYLNVPVTVSYAVKSNGTYTTRPAYTLVDGVRGTKEVSRATVGAACDLYAPFLASSGTDYWAEFGPDFVSGVVALCSR